MLENENNRSDSKHGDVCQVCGKSDCTDRNHSFIWIKNPKLLMNFRMMAMILLMIVILSKCVYMYLNN